ncbi:dimethylarginine dimethylaminohydrolase family protein [Mycolicibacter icosiumassiliensis]|uniref:dimethylarginine dimethylaminohydrolase family protein n=1 Tax=Mycolicibacter icosiumassiliensis TaxID=1792835 RepID=UPI0008350759|nr:arginine deiminase family protein [Mycolicibacter icosiumassiliensis]
MTEVFVESEFAPLRTVLLAQSELALPEDISDSELGFPAPGSTENVVAGKDFGAAFPQRQRLWLQERRNFESVLHRYGVEVLRPRMLTAAEKAAAGSDGYANFFVRDPFFTIGDVVIEGSLRFRHRRREVFPVRDILRERVYPAPCDYVAVPAPEIAADDDATLGPGPFLEGGDVLVLGRHVFVGTSGLASNELGARWLDKLLAARGYTVEVVRLVPDILHLDCALGLIRDGLLVVCEEALLDGVPAALKCWDRIPVSLSQAKDLATNGLPISPDVYVTDPAFSNVGEQLEHRGVTVEYVEFGISRSLGGAFRCSTQPVASE